MEIFYKIGIKRESDEALIESFVYYDEIKLKKNEFTPKEPFEMEITEGNKLYDVVGFQDTSNFAISEKLYFLLREHHITGWRGYEIKIKGFDSKYYGFQVIGRCGKLEAPKKMGFYIGFKFDYNSWDKSDFFSPDDTVLLFCTQKVRDIFIANKITNIEIIELSKVQAYSVGE